MVIATGDLDVHLKQMTERLNAAGISADLGSIVLAGRFSDGSGWVQVNISLGGFASTWPEWAFSVAEGALRFNKKVFVVYNNQPFGNNLLQALWAIRHIPRPLVTTNYDRRSRLRLVCLG
jgi:hypothetical protein